ncbi:hypothetical protein FRX31_029897 [Thalictrum thalictroides]|uniref:F-box associated beta-propeller type 3 domain-containing protein n=1 Tax=Thalictrum thalictroides TaxID=46969 RepID=A0A7J6V8M3_THATH|nr:hypothetical protein FRX31_029897 [Thalictrum thalictroides]
MFYGFGFDKRNQVFKLAVFVFGLDDDNVKKLIFTLGGVDSGWRSILCSIPCMMRYAFGSISNVYVDGCLHWITGNTMPNSTDCTMIIMSFNLSDEAFGVIRTPELLVVDQDIFCMQVNYRLAVLDNCLCWVDSENKKHTNIWIKKGGESWTKSFCLKKSVIPVFGPVTPIKFEHNDHLFLQNPNAVVCYNVQDNTVRSFDVNEDRQGISQAEVFPFVGSFHFNQLPLRVE